MLKKSLAFLALLSISFSLTLALTDVHLQFYNPSGSLIYYFYSSSDQGSCSCVSGYSNPIICTSYKCPYFETTFQFNISNGYYSECTPNDCSTSPYIGDCTPFPCSPGTMYGGDCESGCPLTKNPCTPNPTSNCSPSSPYGPSVTCQPPACSVSDPYLNQFCTSYCSITGYCAPSPSWDCIGLGIVTCPACSPGPYSTDACTSICTNGTATCTSNPCSPQIHQCSGICTTYAECTESCYAQPTANYTLMVNGVPTQGKVSAERLTIKDPLASCTDYEWYVIAEDSDGPVETPHRTFKVYNLPTLTLEPAEFQMEEHPGTENIDFNWTANSCSGTSLTCTVNIDGTPFTKTCTSGQQCSQNYTFNASAVCSHPWSVSCKDAVGQTKSASGTFYITINTCTDIKTNITNPICKITRALNSSSGDCMTINNYPVTTNQGRLTLDCQGYTLTGSGSGSGVTISSSSGVSVSNCDISNFAKGISVTSSYSSGISGSKLHNNAQSGADLSGNTYAYVSSSNVYNNGPYGIYIHGTGSGSVSSDTIYNHDIGIEVVDSAIAYVGSSTIYNNRIGIDLLTSGSGSYVSSTSVHDNSYVGVLVQNNHGATIGSCSPGSCYRNTAYNNPYGSIIVKDSDNVGVSVYGYKHNKCDSVGDMDGDGEDDLYCYPVVHINSSSSCSVSVGYFSNNNRSVYIEDSSGVTVSSNTFSSDSVSVDAENVAILGVTGNTFSGCERAVLARSGINVLEIAHNKITCNSAISLFEVSKAVIYDNYLKSTDNLQITDSTDVVAHVYMPGTANVLGCDNTGGNAWLDNEGRGFSSSCVDLNGDCFCDDIYDTGEQDIAGNNIIDEYPLALSQAYEIGLAIESVGGSMPGTYEQYTSKEYVAATKSSSPEVVFMLVAAYTGKSTCTTNFGNSFTVKNNERSNFTLGGLSQGCYDISLECAPEAAPESTYESSGYFCVDSTPPSLSFPVRSEANNKVVNPDSSEILNESRFFLNASISGENPTFAVSCRLEWGGKEVNFTPSFDGTNQYCQKYMKNGTDNLTIENTTYTYRICATDAAGNEGCSAFKTVTIDAPPLSGGCEACENVGNFSTSALLVVEDKTNTQFKITLYSENLTTFERTAVQYAPVLVYAQNSTYSYLSKAITNDGGTAYFDYSKWEDVAMQYSFSYCCFYEDCGFEMCMNASGIEQDYRDENGISDIFSIPDASPAQPALNPVQSYLLPSVETATLVPEKCATSDPLCAMLQMQQAMCIPVALLFALLLGSLYYTGKNPFAMLDVSPLRLGKHIRYSPRGIGKAQITFQTVQGVASRVGSMASSGAKEKREGIAKGGGDAKSAKIGLFSSIGVGFKAQFKAELAPFVNLVRLVKPGAGKGVLGDAGGNKSFWQRLSVAMIGTEVGTGKKSKTEDARDQVDTTKQKAGLATGGQIGSGWLSALGFAAAGSGTGVKLAGGVVLVSQAVTSYNHAMKLSKDDKKAKEDAEKAKDTDRAEKKFTSLFVSPPEEKAVGQLKIPSPKAIKKPTLDMVRSEKSVQELSENIKLVGDIKAAKVKVQAAEKAYAIAKPKDKEVEIAKLKTAEANLKKLQKEYNTILEPHITAAKNERLNNEKTELGAEKAAEMAEGTDSMLFAWRFVRHFTGIGEGVSQLYDGMKAMNLSAEMRKNAVGSIMGERHTLVNESEKLVRDVIVNDVKEDGDKLKSTRLISELKTADKEGNEEGVKKVVAELKTYVPAEHHGKVDDLLETIKYAHSDIPPQALIDETQKQFQKHENDLIERGQYMDPSVRTEYERITQKMNEFAGISGGEWALKKVVMPTLGGMSGLANAPVYYGMSDDTARKILQSTTEAKDEEEFKKNVGYAGKYYEALNTVSGLETEWKDMLDLHKKELREKGVEDYLKQPDVVTHTEKPVAHRVIDLVSFGEKRTPEQEDELRGLIKKIETKSGVDFDDHLTDFAIKRDSPQYTKEEAKNIHDNLKNLQTFHHHAAATVDSYYKYSKSEETIQRIKEQIEEQKKSAEQQK